MKPGSFLKNLFSLKHIGLFAETPGCLQQNLPAMASSTGAASKHHSGEGLRRLGSGVKASPSSLQRTVSQYQEEAEQTSSALRRAERSVVEKEVQVDELQRLLAGMEKVPARRRRWGWWG